MSKFSEIQLNVASDQAIAGIQKHVPSIASFARSFSSAAGSPFNGIALPIFANLSGVSNQSANSMADGTWCNGEELEGAVVTLDKHISKVYKMSDYTAQSVGDNLYLADASRAIAEQVTLEAVKSVFTVTLGDANLSTVETLSDYTATAPTAKQGFAGLFATASEKGLNPYDTVAVLDAPTFAACLSSLGDSAIYGGPEAVRNGVFENGPYGFKTVVMCPFLASGTKGFLIPYDSIGVASRYDAPAIDGYAETWSAVDPKTGFTISYRVFEHLCNGAAYIGGSTLFGAKILQKGIVKLT